MALTVRKRGEIWHARGTVRVNKQVVTVREFSTGCNTRSAALEAAEREVDRIKAELSEGPEGRRRSLTIAECILAYSGRPGGLRSYDLKRLEDFNERVGGCLVFEAVDAWAEWMRQRGAAFAPGTAARNRSILQAALNYGCRAKGFTAPVLPRVWEPSVEGTVYLTTKQQYRLLACYNKAARQVAITLCYQGLRTGEALGLEWQHVNLTRQTMFIPNSKNGSARTIAIHPVVERRLRRVWVKRGKPTKGRVFLSSRGEPYRIPDESKGDAQGGNPLSQAHATARKKAGIDFPFRVHDFRHNWASHMVMTGCNLSTLMRIGGWKTPRMVQRYAAVSTDHMADVMARMK